MPEDFFWVLPNMFTKSLQGKTRELKSVEDSVISFSDKMCFTYWQLTLELFCKPWNLRTWQQCGCPELHCGGHHVVSFAGISLLGRCSGTSSKVWRTHEDHVKITAASWSFSDKLYCTCFKINHKPYFNKLIFLNGSRANFWHILWPVLKYSHMYF